MRVQSSSNPHRRLAVSLVIATSALSGCFALFSLDGYGPPDTSASDAASDGGSEASRDAASGDATAPGRTIFVTGTTFTGNLGAHDGGDTTCQAIATDAGLSGSYRVWLSDMASDAADHLDRDAGPLRLINGAVVASNVDELVTTGPRTAIAFDERGRPVGGGGCNDGGLAAWTDTAPDGGNLGSLDCARWTSASNNNGGVVGIVAQPGSAWTAACFRGCNSTAALYCIQQ
jgi:hypothetical protein